jgi:hypothetical protein
MSRWTTPRSSDLPACPQRRLARRLAVRLLCGIWRVISAHALTRFASRGTAVPQMQS